MNNCFSIYPTSWITSGPKTNFLCDNIPTKAILFSFGCSEVNSTSWLITSELANQRARKVLFTCVVYTKPDYYEKGVGGDASVLRKEKVRAQVSRKLRLLICLAFKLNLICSWLFRPYKSFYCDTHSRCVFGESGLIWRDLHAFCCMLWLFTEVINNI